MPLVLYKWDFETGDTQGWFLGSYSSLDSTSQVQGTYSIRYRRASAPNSLADLVAYITNIDLSAAQKPLLVFVVRAKLSWSGVGEETGHAIRDIHVVVKDSAGNVLLSATSRLDRGRPSDITKVVAVDLSAVAGRGGLRIEIFFVASHYDMSGVTYACYIDAVHIIDGGDKEYNIALLAFSNMERTLSYGVPDADQLLPSGVTRFAIALATPPHSLVEATDIFTYTAVCSQGSASITTTNEAYRHTSSVVAPTPPPSLVLRLDIGVHVKSVVASERHSFDEVIVVTFWSAYWDLLAVYVFRLAATINPVLPPFQTAMVSIPSGQAWEGQLSYTLRVHSRRLDVALQVSYLKGSQADIVSGLMKLEVYDGSGTTKIGESAVDLTSANLTGPYIDGLPVDTSLQLKISWSIRSTANVVLAVRPLFRVY